MAVHSGSANVKKFKRLSSNISHEVLTDFDILVQVDVCSRVKVCALVVKTIADEMIDALAVWKETNVPAVYINN